ncbi:hypothetical protein HDU76_012903 [Blyttiomyces sp. JEL0837]|nr:hypothetical protein HDU76_012903 [Blyttiomyces sp. JEL0837]
MWKTICWVSHIVLLFPAPIFLLHLRPYWDDIPATLLFGATKEWCRFFLLAAPWVGLLVAVLGWRYLKPPVSKEEPAELPLSPWQWIELREGKADPKIVEAAVWWAEHPASLRQHAEFAVRAWLVWTVLATLFAQVLLICGFEFPFYNIPAWPWAMIPFSFLGGAHYTSVAVQFFVDKGLKKEPIEDRGTGEGVLIPGLDIRSVLRRERKRFDPCGAFPESLSPEDKAFYEKYGRLPPSKKDVLGKQMKGDRKYFDSGDYALSQAGKSSPKDVGSQHPSPERIPHSVPQQLKKDQTPAKESSLIHEAVAPTDA